MLDFIIGAILIACLVFYFLRLAQWLRDYENDKERKENEEQGADNDLI